ncbi:hypothetical protein ACXPWS_01375 [Mycobacterium sp. BMJ-28]
MARAIHGLDLRGRKVVMQDCAGLTLLAERINSSVWMCRHA